MSTELLRVCVEERELYLSVDCSASRYARFLGVDWLITLDVEDQIAECVREEFPPEEFEGELIYELNVTYYSDGRFVKKGEFIENARIDLSSCVFESEDYFDDSECECYKRDIFGFRIGEIYKLYLTDSDGNRILAGLSDCAWFED